MSIYYSLDETLGRLRVVGFRNEAMGKLMVGRGRGAPNNVIAVYSKNPTASLLLRPSKQRADFFVNKYLRG